MIKMEVTFGSYAEAAIAMSALAGMGMLVKGAVKAAEKNDTSAAQEAKADKPAFKVVEKAETPPVQDKPAKAQDKPAKAPPAEAPAITYLDIKKAAGDLIKAGKRDAVVAIFAKFGAASGTDLKEEQWPAVLAEMKTAASE